MPTLSQKRRTRERRTALTAMNSYLAGCVDLITYIKHNGYLTEMDFQVLMRTVTTLEVMLQSWKEKNGADQKQGLRRSAC